MPLFPLLLVWPDITLLLSTVSEKRSPLNPIITVLPSLVVLWVWAVYVLPWIGACVKLLFNVHEPSDPSEVFNVNLFKLLSNCISLLQVALVPSQINNFPEFSFLVVKGYIQFLF